MALSGLSIADAKLTTDLSTDLTAKFSLPVIPCIRPLFSPTDFFLSAFQILLVSIGFRSIPPDVVMDEPLKEALTVLMIQVNNDPEVIKSDDFTKAYESAIDDAVSRQQEMDEFTDEYTGFKRNEAADPADEAADLAADYANAEEHEHEVAKAAEDPHDCFTEPVQQGGGGASGGTTSELICKDCPKPVGMTESDKKQCTAKGWPFFVRCKECRDKKNGVSSTSSAPVQQGGGGACGGTTSEPICKDCPKPVGMTESDKAMCAAKGWSVFVRCKECRDKKKGAVVKP
jgi:hypothetical protein